jgi:hypothetical protein
MTVVTKPFGGYWEPVKVGANRAMGELELTGQVEAPTDEDDPDMTTEAQIEIVKSRREEGYGGLGIAPMRESLAEEMNAFVAAGAPVVTIDSDLPESDRHLYIGTNNGEAGRSAGETLLRLLTEDSGTVIILGYPDEDWPDGYAARWAPARSSRRRATTSSSTAWAGPRTRWPPTWRSCRGWWSRPIRRWWACWHVLQRLPLRPDRRGPRLRAG